MTEIVSYLAGPHAASELAYADRGRMKIWAFSKREVSYGNAPGAEVRCDRCKYMFPPLSVGGCRLVRGVIRGSATCDEFKSRARG